MAQGSENEHVKLAANREILDRFLGKPLAKTETKVTGGTTNVTMDANRLLEEYNRNSQELAARGIGLHAKN